MSTTPPSGLPRTVGLIPPPRAWPLPTCASWRLLVGARTPVRTLADDAAQLHALLAGARATLHRGTSLVDQGAGSNVLDSPLHALLHFLTEVRQCPGAPDLLPGDVVTTGTWTDAWPVAAGEYWTVRFSAPLASLEVTLH